MAGPSSAPTALLIDDGELESFARVLRRMGVDYVRVDGGKHRAFADRPRDLLITSWPKAQRLPRLEPDGADAWEPIWVCVHNQDFLPLRERMRAMGIHFLVNPNLHQESLRLLMSQLLYRGAERRDARRLPVGCEAAIRTAGAGRGTALLAELSEDGARLLSPAAVGENDPMSVQLPVELGLGAGIELRGRVVRCTPWEPDGREPAFAIVLQFDRIEPDLARRLERLLRGQQLGGRVTPLGTLPPAADLPGPRPEPAAERPAAAAAPAARPEPPAAAADPPQLPLDRRASPRGDYRRKVPMLWAGEPDAPDVVLGYDLSHDGMRIAWHPELRVGDKFGVALHGSSREEPLVLQAEIVRDGGVSGFGLVFCDLSEQDGRRLDALIASLEPIASLCEGDPDGSLVVSRLLRDEDDR